MSNVEIMLFYLISFWCFSSFKTSLQGCICKYLRYMLLRQFFCNRFVKLEKEVLLHLTFFHHLRFVPENYK